MSESTSVRIVKNTYYSNWGDRIGYPLAGLLAKLFCKVSFITPNKVTLVSFFVFFLGCFFLVFDFPYHMLIAAILIFAGYIGDDVDGQLARITKRHSVIGDYMDKALDVLKIFLITFFSGFSVYLKTGEIVYLVFGFVACFFFNYRYYIKLETMFSVFSRDQRYFEKSSKMRYDKEREMDKLYSRRAMTIKESIKLFWIKNRTLLIFDEAEFVIFVAMGAIFNKLEFVLMFMVLTQVFWGFWRLFERGLQLNSGSEKLFLPMRK